MAERGVTLEEAGIILGGDSAPWSKRTISRLISQGHLTAYGERSLRRVTMRSIEAYQRGERAVWPRNEAGELPARAQPTGRKTAPGRRGIPDSAVATTSEKVSIPARLPKRGVIR